MRILIFAALLGSLAMLPGRLWAQEVFREFTSDYGAPDEKHFNELDPGSKRKWDAPEQAWARNFQYRAPKPLDLDLRQAVRAEFSVEYWGGHIGTSRQGFKLNDAEWTDLPQPVGTPAAPQRFYRTLLGNNAVPVPLAALRDGRNEVRFSAGPQIAYGWDWGFYWIYDFTARVYYDPARPHPAGEIVAPGAGSEFGETLELEARASSPNGAIVRVEFIGEYDDFDWDGDGVWREWQYTTHHGVLRHHLGTAMAAPWKVAFDAKWLPDQSQPVRVRARLTDVTGLTYLTPPVEVTQRRASRSVRLYRADAVPERFSARDGKFSPPCTITIGDDLARATAARLVVSTWSGSTDDDSVHELRLNGERLANRFGQFHNYSFDQLEVSPVRLQPGANILDLHSTFKGHMLEVNWPGPALLVEYETPAVNGPRPGRAGHLWNPSFHR